jgi:hypothetical protein
MEEPRARGLLLLASRANGQGRPLHPTVREDAGFALLEGIDQEGARARVFCVMLSTAEGSRAQARLA